jgi:hypothetical protein
MKTFNEIINEINAIEFVDIQKMTDELYGTIQNLPFTERLEKKRADEYKAKEQEIVQASADNEYKKTYKHYLVNNAKVSLYEEIKNDIVDIFNKYSGKKYGEKTKEKIRNEILEKTQCWTWLDGAYCDNRKWYMDITPKHKAFKFGDKFGFKIYYENFVDENNIIQKIDLQGFKQSNVYPYVDDIQARIEQLLTIKEEARKLQELLNEKMDEYNKLVVSGINRLRAEDKIRQGL